MFLPPFQNITPSRYNVKDATQSHDDGINLPGEQLNVYVLDKILTGPTLYLDIANSELKDNKKEIQALKQRLRTHRSKLRGLCLSGAMGPDDSIAEIVALLPNVNVLDLLYSRYDLVHKVLEHLPNDSNITLLNIGTQPALSCEDITNVLLYSTVIRLINKCPHMIHLVLHGVELNRETIHYICENLPKA